MRSVLQDWVMELPLREQGTLMTAVRGCDLTPKYPLDSQERQLVAAIRGAFMVPADPREMDVVGGFMRSSPPANFKPSCLGHYPHHWVMHVLHAVEVIAYRHPDTAVWYIWMPIYHSIVQSLHLNVETFEQFEQRMTEDRIAKDKVVS